ALEEFFEDFGVPRAARGRASRGRRTARLRRHGGGARAQRSPRRRAEAGRLMETQVVNPWSWQDRFGFVQGKEVAQATRTLYCAGQTSVDDQGSPLHAGNMEAQALQALANL